jgi:hypothetical protein
MRLERLRSSDDTLDNKQTNNTKRPAREMSNGDYGYGKLNSVTSESRFPRAKKRREGGTPDSSVKFDRVSRKESETQDIASNARIDGMRRNKEDMRGIDMPGRDTARGRSEYRLRNGWGDTESEAESEAEPEKLTSTEWDKLDNQLSKIESAFQTFKVDDDKECAIENITDNAEIQDVFGEYMKEKNGWRENVNSLLKEFTEAVDEHRGNCHDDDETILKNFSDEMPQGAEDPVFEASIRVCRQLIETGKRGAED